MPVGGEGAQAPQCPLARCPDIAREPTTPDLLPGRVPRMLWGRAAPLGRGQAPEALGRSSEGTAAPPARSASAASSGH